MSVQGEGPTAQIHTDGGVASLGLQGLTSAPGDYPDPDQVNMEHNGKKVDDGDSKIDQYLTDNLYYNSEHHQGKSNILEKENANRIATRSQVLEKLGEIIPIFIRDLQAYQNFSKESSFQNLSLLLNV